MVDRDTSQVVDIVAFRDTKEVTEWLKGYPDIEVVSRDGSISYAKALEEAFPQVIQVSDRFRLVKNLTEEAKEYIKRTIPKRIKIAGIEEKNLPTELTEFKCTRQEMLQKRREEEKNKIVRMVKDLYRQGYLSRRISGLQKMLSGSTSDVKVE
ncbi:transposase [Kosmotoga olearia]|uniref:transposase n=1 Tax=Kosmotoga olearia TaxID=651457 RepID=UPI00018496C3|nr:transposase [Kosmotoga olearia]